MQCVRRSGAVSLLAILVLGCATGTKTRDLGELTQRQQAASLNAQLASDYFRQGNWEEAKEKVERALEQDSRSIEAHWVAGLLYDALGEQSKAESHFRRAVSLDDKKPETHNTLASYLCGHGKFAEGEKHALIAAADPLYKTPEVGYLNAGHCARSAGDNARAEKHYRRALDIQPRFPNALVAMTDLEFRAKEFLIARAFLERYMAAAEINATILWLGVQIETALGNRSVAADYARRLKKDFTTSAETKELLEFERRTK